MKILYVDCRLAGISGDMFLSALLDMNPQAESLLRRVAETLDEIVEEAIWVKLVKTCRKGFSATQVKVEMEGGPRERTGEELRRILLQALDELNLGEKPRQFTVKALSSLLEAEAKLHSSTPDKVHLHEAGSADTLIDILGSAVLLDEIGAFRGDMFKTASPVAVGGGVFKSSHGYLASPAPATLEILRRHRIPFVGGPVEAELTTPTGAAILANLVDSIEEFPPAVKPISVGYGAGSRDLKEIPNILRVVYGESLNPRFAREEAYVVEANLDDATGEVLGYASQRILELGALDVFITPYTGKKSRPGSIVSAIVDGENLYRVVHAMLEETGSLGVRVFRVTRFTAERELVEVETILNGFKDKVRVKVARDLQGRILRVKPEFEDLKRISARIGLPVRVVAENIQAQIREKLKMDRRI